MNSIQNDEGNIWKLDAELSVTRSPFPVVEVLLKKFRKVYHSACL